MTGTDPEASNDNRTRPDKPPFSNRVIAAVLVLIVIAVSALRLAYKIEIGRLPFDRLTIAIIAVPVIWFLLSLRRQK